MPDELDIYREEARKDLMVYVQACDPSYIPSRVHRFLAHKLEQVADGKIKRLIVSLPPRGGKALEINTPIPTPVGWKTMGTLDVGDYVFNEKGIPTKVIGVSEIFEDRELYKVQASDGEVVLADAEHEWVVRLCRKKKQFFPKTTKQLFERTSDRKPMIAPQKPLILPEIALPVDPYVLGIWLGDGDSKSFVITTADDFIREELNLICGGPLRITRTDNTGRNKAYRFTCGPYHRAGGQKLGNCIQNQLRQMNLIKNKHIPERYLFASYEQRLALLQGLIDSDGYVAENGEIEYCSINKELAEGVLSLVNSLGVKARLRESPAKIYGRYICQRYRVFFYLKDAARLPRKKIRTRNATEYAGRFIQVFKTDQKGKTRCIQVASPSGMFLCGKTFIPTHNSRLISQEFPGWVLGRDGKQRIILGSYGQELANISSRIVRARLGEDIYQSIFDTKIAEGDASVAAWSTTEGGGYKAVGVGGPTTGTGASGLLIDDVVKDFQEAHSATTLDAIEDWFRSVAMTRLTPDGWVVIIMTRWSRGDLIGRLTDPERIKKQKEDGLTEEWEVVNLPALAHEHDPLGRSVGDSIFPERFPKEWYLNKKAEVGSYVWSALYEGNPVSKGGNYIPVDKLKIIDKAPDGLFWVRYWDLAASEKAMADYTFGIKAAQDKDGMLYLAGGIYGQWEWPVARGKIASTAAEELITVGVEAVSGFKTAFSNLREVIDGRVPLREFGVDKDKLTRALKWIALVENDKVRLVRGPWIPEFIRQAEVFPATGQSDDGIDAVSGAFMILDVGKQAPIAFNIRDRWARSRATRRDRQMVG